MASNLGFPECLAIGGLLFFRALQGQPACDDMDTDTNDRFAETAAPKVGVVTG